MKTPKHHSRDRLRIAEVSGALSNLAGKVNRGELTEDQAVAELHAITTDRHLLAHGLGDPVKRPAGSVALQLALAAGVDVDEAAAIYAEMHPASARGMDLGRRDELG